MVGLMPAGDYILDHRQRLQSNSSRFGSNGADHGGVPGLAGDVHEDLCPHPEVNWDDLNHPHPVCSINATTTVTGDCDGTLSVLHDKGPGYGLYTHAGAVRKLDAGFDHVVSVGVDQVLRVYRYSDGTIKPVATRMLPSTPADIKLVEFEGCLCVAVVGETPTSLDYYTFDDKSLNVYWSLYLPKTASDSFICQEISLNVPRTHYALIGTRGSCVRVIVGLVAPRCVSQVLCTPKGQSQFSFKWGDDNDTFWVIDGKGFCEHLNVDREITRAPCIC